MAKENWKKLTPVKIDDLNVNTIENKRTAENKSSGEKGDLQNSQKKYTCKYLFIRGQLKAIDDKKVKRDWFLV